MDLYEEAGDIFFNGSRNRHRAVEFYRVLEHSHQCTPPMQTAVVSSSVEGQVCWSVRNGYREAEKEVLVR